MSQNREDAHLKLALVEEYRVVLRYRSLYRELTEEFFGLLRELIEVRDRKGLPEADNARLKRLMIEAEKTRASDGSYHREDSDGELPEPNPLRGSVANGRDAGLG